LFLSRLPSHRSVASFISRSQVSIQSGMYLFYSFSCLCRSFTFSQIARLINEFSGRDELSHQQIVFFKKRFSKNLLLILGFFGSRDIVFVQSDFEELRSAIIRRIFQNRYLHSFNLEFAVFQAVHFLG
jgi:hypothetical protein